MQDMKRAEKTAKEIAAGNYELEGRIVVLIESFMAHCDTKHQKDQDIFTLWSSPLDKYPGGSFVSHMVREIDPALLPHLMHIFNQALAVKGHVPLYKPDVAGKNVFDECKSKWASAQNKLASDPNNQQLSNEKQQWDAIMTALISAIEGGKFIAERPGLVRSVQVLFIELLSKLVEKWCKSMADKLGASDCQKMLAKPCGEYDPVKHQAKLESFRHGSKSVGLTGTTVAMGMPQSTKMQHNSPQTSPYNAANINPNVNAVDNRSSVDGNQAARTTEGVANRPQLIDSLREGIHQGSSRLKKVENKPKDWHSDASLTSATSEKQNNNAQKKLS